MSTLPKRFLWLYVFVGLYGSVLAKPKPAFLKPFAYSRALNGYYLVYQNQYFGLLDSSGRQIVPCRYDDIDRFYNGMAEVSLNGKHGYVNQRGKLVIPLVYVRANPFQRGEALVVTAEGDVGYLNQQGQSVRPFSQLGRPYFRGRYAKGWTIQPYVSQLRESVGEFYTSVDASGGDYVPHDVELTQPLRKTGLTLFFSGDRQHRRFGFLDSAGHIVVPMVYEDANETQYGWQDWIRVKKYDRYGFIERQTGREMISIRYEDSQPSTHNIIWVKQRGKWGCIDRWGRTVVPFRFDWASAYVEHRAIVKRGESVGYVDTTGRLTVPIRYDQASYYYRGKARVHQGNRWLELDPHGRVLASGLQTTVLWIWLRYGALVAGVMFFVFYVRRHRISLFR